MGSRMKTCGTSSPKAEGERASRTRTVSVRAPLSPHPNSERCSSVVSGRWVSLSPAGRRLRHGMAQRSCGDYETVFA